MIELDKIPATYAQPDPHTLSKLPKPTSKDNPKGKCDECGGWHGLPAIHLDYMGHADLTLALIDIDPDWNWEPAAIDPASGGPAIQQQGGRLVMWAKLTLAGKTILGVGTCGSGQGDPEKELIGDFLRNAAMRFGVATKLWSKADTADPAGSGEGGGYDRPRARPAQRNAGPDALANDAQLKLLNIECHKQGIEEADRLRFVGELVGREIGSTKELTRKEASAVIDQLKGGAA